jgi:hypothetical protein
VRYELQLLPAEPGTEYPATEVNRALAQRGAADGVWTLSTGPLEYRPLMEAGKQLGLELRIPLTGEAERIRQATTEAVRLAVEAGVRLYDPQLGRPLGEKDEAEVIIQYQRNARYAGEMMGVSEALGASYGSPEVPGLKAGTKVMLALIGLLILLGVLTDAILLGEPEPRPRSPALIDGGSPASSGESP